MTAQAMKELIRWIKRTDRSLLYRIADRLTANDAKLKTFAVSDTDALLVMAIIHGNTHEGVCRLQAPEIEAEVKHDKAWGKARVNRAIRALEALGFIRRETSAVDARRKDILLNEI